MHVIVKPAPAVQSGLLMSNSMIIDLSRSMFFVDSNHATGVQFANQHVHK